MQLQARRLGLPPCTQPQLQAHTAEGAEVLLEDTQRMTWAMSGHCFQAACAGSPDFTLCHTGAHFIRGFRSCEWNSIQIQALC